MNWNRSQPTRMLYATADNAKNLFFPFPVTFRIQVFSFCNLTSLTLSFLFVFLSILFFIYFSADLIFHITCFFLLHVLISSSLIKLLSVFLYNFKKYQSHFNLSTWKIERMLR